MPLYKKSTQKFDSCYKKLINTKTSEREKKKKKFIELSKKLKNLIVATKNLLKLKRASE
tara:strand:- start:517 stop:693 length:177 start_codon:yes stop_codon:yes gene_type:complete